MTDTTTLVLSGLLAGALIGGFFIAGLRATVRRLPDSRHPALLMGLSLVLRFAVILASFYALVRIGWSSALAALFGFVLMRQVLVRRWGPPAHTGAKEEAQ